MTRDVAKGLACPGFTTNLLKSLHSSKETLCVPFELAHLGLDSGVTAEHRQAYFTGTVGPNHSLQEAF